MIVDAELYETFDESEIFSVSGFPLVWDKLKFNMDDQSFSINVGFAFENPTPIELSTIENAEYYITLEKTKVLKMAVQNIGVEHLFNKNFDATLKFTILDENMNGESTMTDWY